MWQAVWLRRVGPHYPVNELAEWIAAVMAEAS